MRRWSTPSSSPPWAATSRAALGDLGEPSALRGGCCSLAWLGRPGEQCTGLSRRGLVDVGFSRSGHRPDRGGPQPPGRRAGSRRRRPFLTPAVKADDRPTGVSHHQTSLEISRGPPSHRPWRLSRAAVRASPSRFKPRTARTIARPGKRAIHHATCRNCWALLAMPPQLMRF